MHQTDFEKVQILVIFLYWMAPLDLLVYFSVIEYLDYDHRSGHYTHKDQKNPLEDLWLWLRWPFRGLFGQMCHVLRYSMTLQPKKSLFFFQRRDGPYQCSCHFLCSKSWKKYQQNFVSGAALWQFPLKHRKCPIQYAITWYMGRVADIESLSKSPSPMCYFLLPTP